MSEEWKGGLLALLLTLAILVTLVVGIRACDQEAVVTCPNGARVEITTHGDSSLEAEQVDDVCHPPEQS